MPGKLFGTSPSNGASSRHRTSRRICRYRILLDRQRPLVAPISTHDHGNGIRLHRVIIESRLLLKVLHRGSVEEATIVGPIRRVYHRLRTG